MGKNNRQRNLVPERRNFKLYKAKKQWITACATFLLTFGATAVMNVSASADANSDTGSTTPQATEVSSNDSTNHTSDSIDSSKVVLSSTAREQPESQNSVDSTPTKQAADSSNNVTTSEASADKSAAQNEKSGSNNQANAQTLKVDQSTKADTSTLKESKAATENIAPIALNVDANMMSVVPGTTLTNDDAKYFIKNYSELEKAGAKFSWVSYTDPSTGESVGYW